MLRAELAKAGVSREAVEAALAEAGPDEVATIRELARRRANQYRDPQKLMAYLARQGFSYGKIKEALEEGLE
jgi:SOS response regulatory protein OraA/RecX